MSPVGGLKNGEGLRLQDFTARRTETVCHMLSKFIYAGRTLDFRLGMMKVIRTKRRTTIRVWPASRYTSGDSVKHVRGE